MKIDEISKKYPVLKEVIKRIKQIDGINNLFPPQADAVNSGYLEGENLVLAIPTCSGKTLVSELAMLKIILENGRKAIYLVPLKALAMEKYKEFKEKYEPLGVKVAVSIGDYDKSDNWLANFDIIITSNEKCDSLLRHESYWFRDIGIIVADEVHLLDDVSRGPTLEVVLTRLKDITNAQILALSATIKNSNEIAEWLDAKLVKSDFRPTKLYEGIYYNNKVYFPKVSGINFNVTGNEEGSVLLSKYVHNQGKQVLIFVSTKRGTEAEAERISKVIKPQPRELRKLAELADQIEGVLDHSTKQCKRLAKVIRNGVAFHHSGLAHEQKVLVEDGFRSGLLKIIAATTSLAYGVNLPSDVCILKDVKRYYASKGYDFIPVLEYKQCAGRAGRLKYSNEGRCIIIAKTKHESKKITKRFILGEPEKISSKLGVEPVLRMHVLALISSMTTSDKKSLLDFFFKTFYAFQYKDLGSLEIILEKVISMLEGFKFINVKKDRITPTLIGKRVSELYIDPLTANYLIKNLQTKKQIHDFGLLQLISNTIEMKPGLNLRKSDWEEINQLLITEESNLIEPIPNPWDMEYDDFLRSIKTALMFKAWTEELGEDRLLEEFGITPGELRVRLDNADWLLYATQELALLLGFKSILKGIRKVRLRMKYGIKEELLPLVRLKGIGRVKARTLWSSNLKSIHDLKKIPKESLARIVGPQTATQIKKQL
jgi:helicase